MRFARSFCLLVGLLTTPLGMRAAILLSDDFSYPDGPLILNPGSVGCPSYDDPSNDPHVSEAGLPHARYAVLTIDEQAVSAEMIAVTYHWIAAATRAEKNGRPEWAYGLRTGWFIVGTGLS